MGHGPNKIIARYERKREKEIGKERAKDLE
jgi:hypothetical protein